MNGSARVQTIIALIAGTGLVMMGGAVVAHHSIAMFDREHPLQLTGVVREFRFVNPQALIVL
jgi:hypothetical protein